MSDIDDLADVLVGLGPVSKARFLFALALGMAGLDRLGRRVLPRVMRVEMERIEDEEDL